MALSDCEETIYFMQMTQAQIENFADSAFYNKGGIIEIKTNWQTGFPEYPCPPATSSVHCSPNSLVREDRKRRCKNISCVVEFYQF